MIFMANVNQKSINKVNKSSGYGKDCPVTTQESLNHENRKTNLLEKK
jgi:hypothetical protein